MKNFIELTSKWRPGETLEVHDEGGGDPESLLFRIKRPRETTARNGRVEVSGPRDLDVILTGPDEVRALFNWLGVWLVKGRHDG